MGCLHFFVSTLGQWVREELDGAEEPCFLCLCHGDVVTQSNGSRVVMELLESQPPLAEERSEM